jgi:hypothetical protein
MRHLIAAVVALSIAPLGGCKSAEPPAPPAPAKAVAPVVAKGAPAVKAAPAAPVAAGPAAGAVKLPPKWRADFPLPAQATITNTSENEGHIALDVQAPGTLPAIADWYQATMKEKGWKQDSKDANPEHISLLFSRKGFTAAVSLEPSEGGKSSVTLTQKTVTEE